MKKLERGEEVIEVVLKKKLVEIHVRCFDWKKMVKREMIDEYPGELWDLGIIRIRTHKLSSEELKVIRRLEQEHWDRYFREHPEKRDIW